MPTLVNHTGFEQGFVGTSGQLFTTVTIPGSSTITAPTTSARSGTYGLRCVGANSTGPFIGLTGAVTSQTMVGRFAFKVDVLPNVVTTRIAEFGRGGDTFCTFSVTTGGILQARARSNPAGTNQQFGVISTGVWYWVDFRFIHSANPWTLDWRVNGVAQTQASEPLAAIGAANWQWFLEAFPDTGSDVGATDVSFDDLAISHTSGDYPLGDGRGLAMVPNAEATHATEANFEVTTDSFGAATELNTITDGWNRIDDIPWTTSATDYLRQSTASTTAYAEFDLTDPSPAVSDGAVVNGVTMLSWMRGATATSCEARHTIDLSGTAPGTTTFTLTTTGRVVGRTIYATDPGGGAWSGADVKALQVRWGHSNDVNPNPWCDAIMVEIDVKTNSYLLPASISKFRHMVVR